MIVVSFDAVGARDLDFLLSEDVFRSFFNEGSYCKNVKSVYPSVTYPAHTSIITGRWPKNHGVVNNTLLQPERLDSPDWMWQRKYVKGKTLYDELLKRGKRVSSTFWPVTARSKVTYNLPEVLPNRPWENQVLVSALNGSAFYELELFKRYGKLMDGIKQPGLDDFAISSALYTLEKYQPDLMLIHLTDVDTTRHNEGVNGQGVLSALKRHAQRLRALEDKLKELGLYEDTVMVILGDHYQKDSSTIYYPNYYLHKAGYITAGKDGNVKEYRAICHEADGSAYVYVKNIADLPGVKKLFYGLKAEGKCGIKEIYTKQQATEFGADSGCSLMLEAENGGYFKDGFHVPSEAVAETLGHGMYATHGYHPGEPGYETFFAIRGAGIKAGHEIKEMCLIDEGPTLAKIWNVSLGNADGRCIEEIFVV